MTNHALASLLAHSNAPLANTEARHAFRHAVKAQALINFWDANKSWLPAEQAEIVQAEIVSALYSVEFYA